MTYGYLRVSTDQQDENNQRMGVDEKASRMGLKIDEYIIDHGVSGTKEPEKRELGVLMKKLKNNDLIIASELSRLGSGLYPNRCTRLSGISIVIFIRRNIVKYRMHTDTIIIRLNVHKNRLSDFLR